MDLYTYVASSNPYQAKSILHKFGYSTQGVQDEGDLGVCLKKLVAYEGQNALDDILSSHPDKEVIIEKYLLENKKDEKHGDCNCVSCSHKKELQYMNFNGMNDAIQNKSKSEVSVFILVSALLLATAIIVKK
jgi:hypothetical protein